MAATSKRELLSLTLKEYEALSEDTLFGAPMKGANNAWTTGRWAEAAGPSHYRSASRYLRQGIRAFEQDAS